MIKKIFTKLRPQQVTKKSLHLQEHQDVWIQKGALSCDRRKKAGITVKQMAVHFKVSQGRLYRFEAGQPVKYARLLEASYLNVVNYEEIRVLLHEVVDIMKELEGRGEAR